MTSPPWVSSAALRSRPRGSRASALSLTQWSSSSSDVARVEQAGGRGHAAGEVRLAEDQHAVARARSRPASLSSQLPPCSAARSTITEPGAMRATISAVTSARRALAGNERGGDHHVGWRPGARRRSRAGGDRSPRSLACA